MTKVLVTGATGFIGRDVYDRLDRSGYEVYGTRTGPTAGRIFCCDITNEEVVDQVLTSVAPDVIIHTAAIASVTNGVTLDYYDVNARGTEILLAAMNRLGGRRRFILLSTAAVYGNQDVEVLHEELCPKPVSHYGFSKFVAEQLAMKESANHDVTVLRLFNVIGKHQQDSFIVPKLINHFKNRSPQILLGNITPQRDYIPISTVTQIIYEFIDNERALGKVVNVAAGAGTSVQQLLEALTSITGHHVEVVRSEQFARNNEVWRMIGCTKKLESILGQKLPTTDIYGILNDILHDST